MQITKDLTQGIMPIKGIISNNKDIVYTAILTIVMTVNCSVMSLAQTYEKTEAADTTGRNLQEVVVEGRGQRIISGGVEYIPDRRSRRFAMDAVDLLANMAIPQLTVTADKDVKTSAGDPVSIFIDFIKADAAALEGIRTEDVARVEVLDYPSDVRFQQAEHVVNIILRKYEWGGYTKLTAGGKVLNNDRAQGGVYSKFSHRDWTFDASVSGRGNWESQDRNMTRETFRDIDYGGVRIGDLVRTSRTERSRGRDNSQSAGLRATYHRGNATLSHTLSYGREAQPSRNVLSSVEFTDSRFQESEGVRETDRLQIGVWANGDYYFALPASNSLGIEWQMGGNRLDGGSEYRLGEIDPVINHERSSFLYPHIKITHSKRFGSAILASTLSSYNYVYDVRFSGSADTRNRIFNSVSQFLLNFRRRWGFGLTASAWAAARYNLGREDGIDHLHRWSPFLRLSLNYGPNDRNVFSMDVMWTNEMRMYDKTAGAVRRQDELLWTQGNPGLRPGDMRRVLLSYTLIPSNMLSLTAHVMYNDNSHMPVFQYVKREGYGGMIRTYSDDCREQELEAVLSGSLRLFGRALSLNGLVCLDYGRNRGLLNADNTNVWGNVSARWSHRNFSAVLFYESPFKTITGQQGVRTHMPCSYGTRMTYALGDFKASLRFSNWFSQGYARKTYESAHYTSREIVWSGGRSRSLQLTLSYTFTYGKHVDRDDEIEPGSGPEMQF